MMKKILLLLLFCAVYITSLQASSDGCRDSIFATCRSLSSDSARVQYMQESFKQHIGEDWSAELLDSALILAMNIKDREAEVSIRYEYFRYHTFRLNGADMEKACDVLKEISYRYKKYDEYFQALHYLIQLKGSEGNTEYAIQKSKEMREEAIRLKMDHGIFLSYISEGKSNAFAQNMEKAIELYKKALEIPGISLNDELTVHNYLSSSYYFLDKYPEMRDELQAQRKIIDDLIKKNPDMLNFYRKSLLDIEMLYCKVYLAESDAENLKRYLDEAAKFYSDDTFSTVTVNYHFYWAGYYLLKKDWDRCFPEFERSLSAFKGAQPMYENNIRRIMGDAYMDAGRYKEAANTYMAVALKRDSINKATLRMNEETVQANYRIKKALLEKEIGEKRFWQIAVVGGALLIILLVIGLLQLLHIRRELVKSEKEMRKSYALAEAADKMKDVFLHNITNEIRGPLNLVVTLSDRLCKESDLQAEQQQRYSEIIKQNAEKLINLIFDILDLSRLESGMMKFNIEVYDMVQLCKEAKLMLELKDGNKVSVNFRTELDSLFVSVDTVRFRKLLSSVIMPSMSDEEPKVEYTLHREDDNSLRITVINSPLLGKDRDEKEIEIRHAINRLYLESFNGRYQVREENGERLIIITYPIK